MKSSRKKIWSIPISLALVLALAAMVGLYGIVQAQTIPGATFFDIEGTDNEVGTVVVRGLVNEDNGDSNDRVISSALTGTGSTHFSATPAGTLNEDLSETADVDESRTQNIVIGVTSGDAAPAGVYNLTMTSQVDLDIDTDGEADDDTTPDNDEDRTITSSHYRLCHRGRPRPHTVPC